MPKIITTIFALIAFQLIFSQNSKIQGVVSDNQDQPVPDVHLIINEQDKGTTTNLEGFYEFDNLNSGQYTIKVTAVGFSPQQINIRLKPNQNKRLNIILEDAEILLQAVEIIGRREKGYNNTVSFSATKSAAPLKEVPTTINFVTKELALDQAAYTVNDVVKNMSGVNQYSFYNDISIRGFRVAGQRNSGNLVNGMRTFTSFWKQQIIPHIERVEVIKGPASALFGNASPGGTINRVTKKPLATSRQSIHTSLGSFNTLRLLGDFTGPMDKEEKLLYRLNIGYETSDGFRDLQFSKNLVVAPSFSFLPSEKTRFNVDLVYQNSKGRLDRGQAVFGNGDLYSTPITKSLSAMNDYLNEISINATVSFQHQFNENLTFNSIYMRSSYDEDLLEHRTSNRFASLADGSFDTEKVAMRVFNRRRNWDNNNFSNYFNFNYDLGNVKNQLLVGYDFFQQELQPGGSQLEARTYLLKNGGATNVYNPNNVQDYVLDANGNPATNVAHFDLTSATANGLRDMSNYIYNTRTYNQYQQHSHGIYLQNQAEIGKLKLLLGLRQEYFTDYLDYNSDSEERVKQSAFLPRIGLVYSATHNINVYGTWVKGYEPQSASDILNPDSGGPFDPLLSELFEFGAKSEWFNNKLSASVAFYHLSQKNTLYNADDPSNPERLEPIGKEVAKGVELDIVGNITSNWSLVAGYAYNDAKITESDDPSEIGRQKPNAPKHTANLWTKYLINQGQLNGLGFGFGYNYVSERFGSLVSSGNPPTEFPAYSIFDAALYYKLNKIQVQLNVNNLFDKTHWVGGYDLLRAFPGAPRNVMLSVGYTF